MSKENICLTYLRILCVAVAIGSIVGIIHGLLIGSGVIPEQRELRVAVELPTDLKSVAVSTTLNDPPPVLLLSPIMDKRTVIEQQEIHYMNGH